jgi:N-acetyltransferase 10
VFGAGLALYLLDPSLSEPDHSQALTEQELNANFTPYDIKRLEAYTRNLIDFHVIMDLMPLLSRLYFLGRVPVTLSSLQAAILVGVGLQHKTVDDLAVRLSLSLLLPSE